ncbi:MAG: flagellar biosynthesis protein [Novosphingobium sp.]|nr:flagellar biosynthesis protein [Novosphingobium sp.]
MSDRPAAMRTAAFDRPAGFRLDPRFTCQTAGFSGRVSATPAACPAQEANAPDPIATARAEGYAEGLAHARAEALATAEQAGAAHEKLALSFARLDREQEEDLRLRLRETIAVLCETAIAPLALDTDALVSRIDTAVSMLARADDARVIRLNPDDIALLSDRMRSDWQVEADPALERGALRVECATGGVEDGPAIWRRTIAEALKQC